MQTNTIWRKERNTVLWLNRRQANATGHEMVCSCSTIAAAATASLHDTDN